MVATAEDEPPGLVAVEAAVDVSAALQGVGVQPEVS